MPTEGGWLTLTQPGRHRLASELLQAARSKQTTATRDAANAVEGSRVADGPGTHGWRKHGYESGRGRSRSRLATRRVARNMTSYFRARDLRAHLAAAPKSVGWRLRAVVGPRLRWYDSPEEVR